MTLPLEGIRVADFSWVIAGPFATLALAMMGAEVIRIESSVHTDINRRLPPGAEGILGTERSGLWHGLNLNKKSVTLDLRRPEGQELAKELVRRSDIAIENFAFGQMEKFNLGYEELKKVKPDIIFVSSSGLGRTGPYRKYVTFGPPLTAYTGLASLTGQDGGEPERWIAGVWTDHQSAMASLLGLLAALEHRDRTGEGQMVDYSMAEVVAGHLSDALIEFGLTGDVPGPRGNRDLAMCPHGIFRSEGDDRWVAIAVQDDEDWRRLLTVMAGPAWLDDASLATAAGRLARRQEVEGAVTAWTRTLRRTWPRRSSRPPVSAPPPLRRSRTCSPTQPSRRAASGSTRITRRSGSAASQAWPGTSQRRAPCPSATPPCSANITGKYSWSGWGWNPNGSPSSWLHR